MDQHQVAGVDDETEELTGDEHGIKHFPTVEQALAVARAAEGSAQAVLHAKERWARDQQALSVTANRNALAAFSASRGVGAELDANGMISTRKAVETCEMVLEALEISGI